MQHPLDHDLRDPREALSALMDGEHAGDQGRFLARRLESDAALAAQVGRWQFAGEVLRQSAAQADATDQVPDLWNGIQTRMGEITPSTPATTAIPSGPVPMAATTRPSRGMRAWGGLALAAALGVVAITVRPGLEQPTPVASENPAVAAQTKDPGVVTSAAPAPAPALSGAPSMTAALATQPTADTTMGRPDASAALARPWRAPSDTDALIARAKVRDAAPEATTAPENRARTLPRSHTGAPAMVASVPKSIQRTDDVERVIRGQREQTVFPGDVPAGNGWPRSVIPGVGNGAFNASFGSAMPADGAPSADAVAPRP